MSQASVSGLLLLLKLKNTKVAVPLLFGMIFLWLNGEYYWGPAWDAVTAQAYILMFLAAIALGGSSGPTWVSHTRPGPGLLHFWTAFLMAFAALLLADEYMFQGQLSGNPMSSVALYPTFFLHAFFVAPVEETLFRGILKDFTKGWRLYIVPLSPIVTAGSFAMFHVLVYGSAVMSLWWAFLLGVVFWYVTELRLWKGKGKLGVPGSIGVHLCYNLFVLGALTLG